MATRLTCADHRLKHSYRYRTNDGAHRPLSEMESETKCELAKIFLGQGLDSARPSGRSQLSGGWNDGEEERMRESSNPPLIPYVSAHSLPSPHAKLSEQLTAD